MFSMCWAFYLDAQVGLIQKLEGVYDGLTLIHPQGITDTYLIDNDGTVVHIWPGDLRPGNAVYLLENGLLLRAGRLQDDFIGGGGKGGRLELVEWDGTVNWAFDIASDTEKSHHDMQYLPNGNILAIVWELKDEQEALANGRNPSLLDGEVWPDKIVEIKPLPNNDAEIVWEWHSWDHLVQDYDNTKMNFGVISEQSGRIDVNQINTIHPDWLHINGISYNEELDQILVSSAYLNEIWVIDHSTTTEEAASSSGGNSGLGGDLLYRWGNPKIYGLGEVEDQKLFGQHNPTWIEEDNVWKILLFNNGVARPQGFISTVEIITPPLDNMGRYNRENLLAYRPTSQEWIYALEPATDLYSAFISGAQKLPNGNFLICSGTRGHFVEITSEKNTVWEYICPIGSWGDVFCPDDSNVFPGFVFRAEKYALDFAGLGELSDLGEWGRSNCPLGVNPFSEKTNLNWHFTDYAITISSPHQIRVLEVLTLSGKTLQHNTPRSDSFSIETNDLFSGIYIIKVLLETGEIHFRKCFIQ